ncbi:MAG TPA: chitobiase/beta-hexosaminidase C-terminal domain-containing protein [Methylomirabilota bacterium]|nr:chitobiase/beta-hexosaminidase C-terminal domain-containing protein [Methylomirabilota bacterium]
MKTLLHKWRGLQVAAAIAITTFAAHGAAQIKTLGGGPNQLSPARSGSANGDTLNVAKFNNPNAVAIDANGNLYIADRNNNKIRKVTRPGNSDSLTSTFASRLKAPVGVAVDASNRVYVVTYSDGRLRVFNSNGSLERTVSGLMKPTALTLDEAGNVYVTEFVGNVKQIAPDSTVTLIASGFVKPQGITLLRNGLLAVSETGNHAIYTVDPATGTTTLIAGHNGPGYNDGPGVGAQFNKPYGLAVAPNGSLVVADRANHRVRVINTNNVVSTLYGVARQQWVRPFVGWVDGDGGDNGIAAAHDPIGVTVATNGTVYITEIFWDLIRQASGTGLGVTNSSTTVTNGTNVTIVLDVPTFSPNSGYFPFGVTVTVTSTAPVFYTTDGTEPTTNSRQVALTGNVGTLRFSESLRDLTSLRLRAIGTNGASATVGGVRAGVNEFGIPRDIVAGSGATVVVPVVANLRASDRIQSFQYRVEVTPQNGAPPVLPFLRASSVSPNDFIQLVTVAPADQVAHFTVLPYTVGNVRGLVVTASGTNANVDFQNFATTAMLVVPIDPSAVEGHSYRIRVSDASATSDGYREEVPLTMGPARTISISSVPYLVGDTAPGGGYNAGEFGNGDLANNDANAVLFASVGLRRPFEFTDAFNAMDAFPPEPSAAGGDGVVEFADWQVVLNRSLRLDPNNWSRRWIDGGILQSDPVALAVAPSRAKSVAKAAGPGAILSAADVYNAPQGVCEVAVSVNVAPGYIVAGMAFRVVVEADGGAAPVSNVSFTPMLGNSAFQSVPGGSPNDIVCAWTMVPSPALSLQGENLLGRLRFNIPAHAVAGQRYTIRFIRPSGAADLQTAVSFDSVPGSAWVLSTPPQP